VYREETRPIVDVAIDGTASMAVSPKKATRALELALLCIAAGERAGASVRVSCVWQGGTSEGDAALMSADFGTRPGNATEPLAWDQVRWRPGGLRVVVSDFLSSIPPSDFFTSQGTARCVPILLAPYDREEADPDWTGQVDLIDCESAERRDLHFDSAAAERYRGAYSSHFESWREATLRREGIFARVNSAGDLPAALLEEAIPAGAFGFER